jgi:hypothetical protein
MSNELVQFGQILSHLLSTNNDQRNQAEKIFESTKQSNPEFFVSCLLHYLKGSTQEEVTTNVCHFDRFRFEPCVLFC